MNFMNFTDHMADPKYNKLWRNHFGIKPITHNHKGTHTMADQSILVRFAKILQHNSSENLSVLVNMIEVELSERARKLEERILKRQEEEASRVPEHVSQAEEVFHFMTSTQVAAACLLAEQISRIQAMRYIRTIKGGKTLSKRAIRYMLSELIGVSSPQPNLPE